MLRLQLLRCYCYSDTEFCYNCYNELLSLLRVPGDTATLNLLLLTSFAAAATAIAYADASVGRVALLQLLNVICCCDCNCFAAIATPTSSYATVATTNALSLVRVPEQTATLPLLLQPSFATITTPIAYADASVARVEV